VAQKKATRKRPRKSVRHRAKLKHKRRKRRVRVSATPRVSGAKRNATRARKKKK